MTRALTRRPPTGKFATMSIGATYTRMLATVKQRDAFRSNVRMFGRRYGRKFQFLMDGLTVTVMRIG